MFCQNQACGTEVASSYKICPKCGGKSFGPQRGITQPTHSAQGSAGNKTSGFFSHDGGGNTNKSLPINLIQIVIGVAVLLSLAVFGYQYLKEAEIHKQEEMARIEAERAREIELKRIAEEARLRAEEEARQRQAEIEREHRKQEAQRLAEAAKDAIINKAYQGGKNKGVSVQEWSYDSVEDRYMFKVGLSWDGAVFTSNHYAADGTISIKSNGEGATWNPTWVNDQLREYQDNRSIAGGVVVIGAVVAASSSSSRQ